VSVHALISHRLVAAGLSSSGTCLDHAPAELRVCRELLPWCIRYVGLFVTQKRATSWPSGSNPRSDSESTCFN